MTIKPLKIVGAALMLGLMSSANAASISLSYTGPADDIVDGVIAVAIGSEVSFDITMDFSDQSTIGGGFDVIFDSSALEFQNFSNNNLGDPSFGRDPDVMDGLLESWAFANFNPLTGPDLVGSVTFRFLGTGGGTTMLALGETDGIGGPFIDGTDFVSIIDVNYNALEIRAVPVPAAVWFMLSGLGALLGFGRKAA